MLFQSTKETFQKIVAGSKVSQLSLREAHADLMDMDISDTSNPSRQTSGLSCVRTLAQRGTCDYDYDLRFLSISDGISTVIITVNPNHGSFLKTSFTTEVA